MLWQLIKLLCLPLVYQSSVMEDVCENGISTEELDKIEVACQFHYHNLPDYCFVRTAVRAISDPSFFEQHVLHGGPDQRAASTTTRAVYTTHLQNLHTWGVVRSIGFLCIRTVCRYFAVAKTENTSRSIFDGRNISLLCHPPPGMRLPDRSYFHSLKSRMFSPLRKRLVSKTKRVCLQTCRYSSCFKPKTTGRIRTY